MSGSTGDLRVRLGADTTAFDKAMRSGKGGLDKMKESAKSTGAAFISLNQGLEVMKKAGHAAAEIFAKITDAAATDAYLKSVKGIEKAYKGFITELGAGITESAAFQEALKIVSEWFDKAADKSKGLGTSIGEFLGKALVSVRYALAAWYGLLATGAAVYGGVLKGLEKLVGGFGAVADALGFDGLAKSSGDAERTLKKLADDALQYASDKAMDTYHEVNEVAKALDRVGSKTGERKGKRVGSKEDRAAALKAAEELAKQKEDLIKQDMENYRAMVAAQDKAQAEFLTGQADAIQSYEDLMVAGDEEATRAIENERKIQEVKDARGKGFLSGDQEKAALDKLKVDYQKTTADIAEAHITQMAEAGASAAAALGGGIKSFFSSHDPRDLFKGLLSALGGVLKLIPGIGPVAGAIFGAVGNLMHSGGEVGMGAQVRVAHSGMAFGMPKRNDEYFVKAQSGEGFVSKIGMSGLGKEGLDQLNRTGTLGGGGNSYTQIVSSLDTPSYSAFAPRTVEPVQKQRWQDRAGSMNTQQLRKTVRERRVS
jgi:hypothetical protein